ncbi:DUF177 domain-containing protein [Alcaligenaceae bacterium CGII-47]|nr:DUF177 domain-containing protein [Alcaligenaceae bacterium CGII-47]
MKTYVNALEFARLAQSLRGEVGVSQLVRLTEDLPEEQPGHIVWQLEGRRDGAGRLYLDVQAHGEIQLECQRCLQPFAWPVVVRNALRLLASRSEVEAMEAREAQGDPGDEEYILAGARLDGLSVVEDELILALPYVPTHEVCPDHLDLAQAESEVVENESKRPSPFAVLGQLKKH